MSSAIMSDAPAVQPPGSSDKKDKSSKKSKKEHKTKKRDREPEAAADGDTSERKSKKPKQSSTDDVQVNGSAAANHDNDNGNDEKHTKKKKDKKRHRVKNEAQEDAVAEEEEEEEQPAPAAVKKEKKSKKSKTQQPEAGESILPNGGSDETTKKKKKRDRKSKDHDAIRAAAPAQEADVDNDDDDDDDDNDAGDVMEIDSTPAKKTKRSKTTSKPSAIASTLPSSSSSSSSSSGRTYPFYTQTVSLYLPLYPAGMTEPLEGYAEQHLKLLVNRYVPELKGILLAYRNPRLGERPGAKSLTEASSMEDVALLESISEYAVAYGWYTVEVDVFRPARGAWMEGTVNLQSEGFVGVVCFDMFNASIEAARLPEGWRWVDLLSSSSSSEKTSSSKNNSKSSKADTASDPFADEDSNNNEGGDQEQVQETEADLQTQLHSTGYWVDATGSRVTGKLLPFRIKNYEVGSSETHGYLSIEGTMLDEGDELRRVLDEREEARRRRRRLAATSSGGYLSRTFRKIPDFATTRFELEQKEEDGQEEYEAQRAVQWKKTSSPGGSDSE